MNKKLVLMGFVVSFGMFNACSNPDPTEDFMADEKEIPSQQATENDSISNEELPNGSYSETDRKAAADSIIVGTWELKTICYPEGNTEIPVDDRDLFIFGSNGKVKVVIRIARPLYPDLPNRDGEYDYSYDMENQILQLCGKPLKCVVSDDEMHIEGYHDGPDDGIEFHEFIFIKKQN